MLRSSTGLPFPWPWMSPTVCNRAMFALYACWESSGFVRVASKTRCPPRATPQKSRWYYKSTLEWGLLASTGFNTHSWSCQQAVGREIPISSNMSLPRELVSKTPWPSSSWTYHRSERPALPAEDPPARPDRGLSRGSRHQE